MKRNLEEILNATRKSLIISCQALPSEPLYCEEMSIMPFMAKAAMMAGSKCIRTSSIRDVIEIKKATHLPVIGLIKRVYEGYESYITPTMREIDELVDADADIIALDCTMRQRGDSTTINEFISSIIKKYPNVPLMADISTYEEGMNAYQCGMDIISTTMSGYTSYSPQANEPDFDLVKRLVKDLPIPLIAEGKIHTPEQAKRMLELGAHAVVIGGAITRPFEIATRFYEGIQ